MNSYSKNEDRASFPPYLSLLSIAQYLLPRKYWDTIIPGFHAARIEDARLWNAVRNASSVVSASKYRSAIHELPAKMCRYVSSASVKHPSNAIVEM